MEDLVGTTSSYTTTQKEQSNRYRENSPPPLSNMAQHSNREPSHDYLQTLLHVNEELLAESLSSNISLQEEERPIFMSLVPQQQQHSQLITPPLSVDEINNTTHTNSIIINNNQRYSSSHFSTPPITPDE
jgi:hypothetical protein